MNIYSSPFWLLSSEHYCCELRAAEVRFNPYHDEKGRFAQSPYKKSKTSKHLTKSAKGVKLDSKGKPFKYPPVTLESKEYANVVDEIGRWWNSRYKGRKMCYMKFTRKTYYFENHGIGDYNIYMVVEDD